MLYADVTLADALRTWIAFTLPALVVAPWLRRAFPHLADGGWAFARTVGALSWTLVAWWLAVSGLTPWGDAVVIGVGIAGAAIALPVWWRDRTVFRSHASSALVAEGVFLVVFVGLLALAPLNGALHPRAERFMDYAFLQRIAVTTTMPPVDGWLAGETVHYYYHGYTVLDVLRRISGVDLARFFNFALAATFASLAVAAYGAGCAAARRRTAGVLAALLVVFGGNMHTWIDWCSGKAAHAVDWFGAARVVDGAITEFPWFAWLWGDPHPYVLAMPIVATAIGLIAAVVVRPAGGSILGAATAIALVGGALVPTNTWDYPAVAIAAGVGVMIASGHTRRAPMIALGTIALSLALYAPFTLDFIREGTGVALRASPQRTPLPAMMTMWAAPLALGALGVGPMLRARRHDRRVTMALAAGAAVMIAAMAMHTYTYTYTAASAATGTPAAPGWIAPLTLLIALVAAAIATRAESTDRIGPLLLAVALCLILAVEVAYLDDHYRDALERMNTVFKAYAQAWVWAAIGASVLAVRSIAALRGVGRWAAVAATIAIAGLALGYAAMGTISRYGSFERTATGAAATMDALAHFRQTRPHEAEAATWLAQNTPSDAVIVEAYAHAYAWPARFATVTGRPTIVGWLNHEAGWRGSWTTVNERARDVDLLYRTRNLGEAVRVARRYGAAFVIVGTCERERECYRAGLAKFAGWELAFASGRVRIYRVPEAATATLD